MSRHSAAIARIRCPWRKTVALVVAFVSAGAFVPFAYTMHGDPTAEEEDEEASVLAPQREPHGPVSWPAPAVSLVHPGRTTPELHKPTDAKPQAQHKPPPKTVKVTPPPPKKKTPPPPTISGDGTLCRSSAPSWVMATRMAETGPTTGTVQD